MEKVRALLPDEWQAEHTLEGRLIYWYERDARMSTWTHPNPEFTAETIWDREKKKKERAPFQALSYTWGDPTPVQPITIFEGTIKCRMLITHNLFEALLHLRLKIDLRHLWVDSVSINQEDLQERAPQVRSMYKIYSCAPVIVWMDPADSNSDLAIRQLRHLGEQVECLKTSISFLPAPGCSDLYLFANSNLTFDDSIHEAIEG